MTRYSSSRGMMYTAPPTDDDKADVEVSAEVESAEPTPADD